jgi:hypothetical protein
MMLIVKNILISRLVSSSPPLPGYEVADKSKGLDRVRMEIALKKLAQFHASSAIYYENNGRFNEKYSRGLYNADMASIFEQHFDVTFVFILDEFLSTWPNLDNKIIGKMVRELSNDCCMRASLYCSCFFILRRKTGESSFLMNSFAQWHHRKITGSTV